MGWIRVGQNGSLLRSNTSYYHEVWGRNSVYAVGCSFRARGSGAGGIVEFLNTLNIEV